MSLKEKVAIITSGYFPVPAVLGGAVEALDENLLRQNEVDNRLRFVVFSCYNSDAELEAKKYKNSSFVFVKIPSIIKQCDKFIYFVAKNILKRKKSMSYRYILQRLYYIKKVAQNLHHYDYDKIIVENHSSLFMSLKKFNNKEKYEGKYYFHLHNMVTNDYGCKDIISNCKKVLGVSNYINKTLHDFLGESDCNEYCVLRNRIDRDKFVISLSDKRKMEICQKFDINSEDVVVLFSGRFNEEKGIRELLEAFTHINNKKIKLLVVGGYYFGSGMISPFEQEMYKLADIMKEKVKFTGFLPYETMPEIYMIADIVAIPSIWDDPAPLTVIEALTSGKALITTNSGGIPEYVSKESSIILLRDKSLITELSNSINLLADNIELRKKMETEAKKQTITWNVKSFYDDFCGVIDC